MLLVLQLQMNSVILFILKGVFLFMVFILKGTFKIMVFILK